MTKTTNPTKRPRSKILILTASIGSGHLSVSRAIAEELGRFGHNKVDVEIVDFISKLKNFVVTATKNIYLNSLKISPKIYDLIFTHSSSSKWPVKFLNLLSAPFMEEKFLDLMRKIKPSMLISTFPVWDFLIKSTWEKYKKINSLKAPFISVVTDSISIHNAWTAGNPDFYLVPNEDTRVSLINHGVSRKKIKVFGYPIAKGFFKHHSHFDFEQRWNLSQKKKTVLLILSTGTRWSKIKHIARAIQNSSYKNFQLIIVATGQSSWVKKLRKINWPWPTQVTGWTNDMPCLISGADIVMTKAGGATIMECIACAKPIIIIDAIPGHEMGNAMLVQKYNLGVMLSHNADNLDLAINHIFSNETLIKRNLRRQQKPAAAERIARFLLELI